MKFFVLDQRGSPSLGGLNAECEMEAAQIEPDERLLISVKNAAKTLGIGQTTTWGLVGKGALEARRIGGRTLVTMESVRRVAQHGAA